MKTPYLLIVLILTIPTLKCVAQDPHFSHIHASPLNNNPAWTGVFNDQFRLITNYRNQWKSPTSNFHTFAISLDARFVVPSTKLSLNAGVSFLSDRGGDLRYGTDQYNFLGAMTLPLDRKGRHFFSLGMQAGFLRHSIDISKIQVIEEEPLIQMLDLDKAGIDLSAGVGYFLSLAKRKQLYAGVSIYHLNQTDVGVVNDIRIGLYKRYVANAGVIWEFHRFGMQPSAILYWQGPHRELNMGSYLSFYLKQQKHTGPAQSSEMRLSAGLWMRYYINSTYDSGFDALIFSTRYEVESLIISFSFDITLSELVEATTIIGSPELSLIYTFSTKNSTDGRKNFNKNNKQRIQCPAF
ncbi:MAG: type IX secretion system membrane protein PorP/SprF [Bacteroidetes bacterium]|nr:type IX secretion system membrane protein PorP/SprF [Bacteroidota bacterium]